ncbi:putative murein hydrolase (TIGR00659 family) [Ruminiclostridium sufflavum DSM 19573]|uniref:Putative murein hydrolase (TIGR00659 family) n=1 Tax=Ruminiclostridium sufflavum DSM 19573 TaxID=1121337 RepID=A0A318Y8X6_9FIRM|nr:LrgB family protein [Ruminiclostridium sufflavum]PYG88768.1 putative murein hydrolase (TIGR00659 family) [Ruminiclostridium sufflavum DSM 19573]
MKDIVAAPIFALLISILAYEIGIFINKKTKIAFFNPLMIAIALVIGVLLLLDIPLEDYKSGGDFISLFLTPATVILAVPLYRNINSLKKDYIAILGGVAAGCVTAVFSIWGLAKVFGLPKDLLASLIPKSITTPLGIELSNQIGGIPSVTVAAIIITGIVGAVFAQWILRVCGITDKTAKGIAIGTSAHALGTTKAVELGETEGAMSGLAIGLAGLVTVIAATILSGIGMF